MHLRDRGGGDGGPEAGIDFVQRLVERGGDGGFRLALRERRHLVLQAFEIARDRLADHVGPGGHELAELDVSRPELGQRGGEPAGAVFGARPLDQPGQRDRGLGRQRQGPRIDQREHAFAREHETGARQAGEMGEGGDHVEALAIFRSRWSTDVAARAACSLPLKGGGDDKSNVVQKMKGE